MKRRKEKEFAQGTSEIFVREKEEKGKQMIRRPLNVSYKVLLTKKSIWERIY